MQYNSLSSFSFGPPALPPPPPVLQPIQFMTWQQVGEELLKRFVLEIGKAAIKQALMPPLPPRVKSRSRKTLRRR